MKKSIAASSVGLLLAICLNATSAQAQRYVSRTGADNATCGHTTLCRTLQQAHSVASAGEAIICVDDAVFGTLFIDRSITIDCAATGGKILTMTGEIGVRINAPGSTVTLRGLSIQAVSGGNMGVYFENGSTLHVDQVRIAGFRDTTRTGLYFAPPAGTVGELHVTDSFVTDNGTGDTGGGIAIVPGAGAVANVSIARTKVQNNSFGIAAFTVPGGGGTRVSIADTVSSGAINSGIAASTGNNGAPITMMLSNVVSANNGTIGVIAAGFNSTIRISGSTITGNQNWGVFSVGGGIFNSYKNNTIGGNGTDGTPIPAFPGPGGTPLQ